MTELTLDELAIVFLDSVGVTRRRIKDVIRVFGSPYKALSNLGDEKLHAILENKLKLVSVKDLNSTLERLKKYLIKHNVSVTTLISDDFPLTLKNIQDSPVVLYYKGDLSILSSDRVISIVGTRKPTNYGKKVVETFVKDFVNYGLVTVSGLAYGIDGEVARATLNNGGKTVAILGGGLNHVYPSSNTSLADEIVKRGGLVMSEYWIDFRPTKYTFPERNRLISGAGRSLLLIEAGEHSGSLITASSAIEQGRELFIVPANIDSIESFGSNKLLEVLPHALTINSERILEFYGLKICSENKKQNIKDNLTDNEIEIIDALTSGEKTFDELCEILVQDPKSLNILLTELEISGIIRKLPGGTFGI